MTTPSDPMPSVDTRLREAEAHLGQARERLDASPPDYAAALSEVLASVRASLRALIARYGPAPDDEAPLSALAERAVRCDSVLKTAVNRALRLAARAPAIERAMNPSVHDREDVETGWYTARNLYHVVEGRLAAGRRAPAA